jgi:hypothetical protein
LYSMKSLISIRSYNMKSILRSDHPAGDSGQEKSIIDFGECRPQVSEMDTPLQYKKESIK